MCYAVLRGTRACADTRRGKEARGIFQPPTIPRVLVVPASLLN